MATPLKKKLLIVEDEPDHAELIKRSLKKRGNWEISLAETLEEAHREVSREMPDLVLADLNLPDGQSTDLCRHVPVVIMTSHGDEHRAVFAMKAGALDYVVKTQEALSNMGEFVERAYREVRLRDEAQRAQANLLQMSGELRRNNQRLSAILESATALARIEDPGEALRFMAHVLRRELGARLILDETAPEDRGERPSVPVVVSPTCLRATLGDDTSALFATIELTRDKEFDESERSLVQLAMSLTAETVRVLRTQEQLRASEARLFQAEKLKSVGQLAGGVAHDFNNMLMGIMGAAEIIDMDLNEPPESVAESVESILEISDQAANLVAKLLTFSRRGSGAGVRFEISSALKSVKKLLALSLPPSIELALCEGPELTAVCDPTLFQNAILNLGINARDAMPGGGKLLISSSEVQLDAAFLSEQNSSGPPGSYLEIIVKDDGVGMDAAVLSRIFDPFFTTKEAGKGTGLGLSVVFGTFQDAGGCVTVESTLERGTTFHCYLPCTPRELPEAESSEKESLVPPSSGKRVLIVDDNLQVLRSVVNLVTRLGHDVTGQSEPQAALSLAETESFDVIIVDVVMPSMGGTDFVRILRTRGLETPVLFMSGYHEEREELKELSSHPRVRFIEKPFRLKDIEAALGDIFRSS